MNFTSPEFLLFFPVVLALYYFLPVRARWGLLLAASWTFYLSWNPWTGILLILATACSYAAGLRIEAARTAEGGRGSMRFWSFVGIGVPLACLIVFKYAGFFANTTSDALAHLGIRTNISLPRFILPIGISFYTFQTLSYVIDVRRGTIPAERHFGIYALFVSFFPQLVAGPIERPGNLIPQLRKMCGMEGGDARAAVPENLVEGAGSDAGQEDKESSAESAAGARQTAPENSVESSADARPTAPENSAGTASSARKAPRPEDLSAGFTRILVGFFKKLAVADVLASFVEPVYGNPTVATPLAVILSTVLFAAQIYCDFSGYSDIACGAARMMGIRLTENFDSPYRSESVRGFWRRWHITLSTWLTDYIYIPLGGNRRGRARQLANVTLVFLISGLWHGADLTFVVWGLLHGGMVCAEILLSGGRTDAVPHGDVRETSDVVPHAVRRILTFAFVCFTWIFFRADNLGDAGILIGKLFSASWANAFADTISLMGLSAGSVLHIALALWCLPLLDRLQEKPGAPVPSQELLQEKPGAPATSQNRPEEKTGVPAVHPGRRLEESVYTASLPGRPQAESRALFIVIMVMTIAASWLMLLGRSAGNVFIYFQF